jgi:L-malate glycosyltransferase
MKILFVSHTPLAGGAEEGLMRLLGGLGEKHSVAVACPAPGPLAERVDAAGVRRYPVPAFEASLRPHPLHTPAGIARLGAAGVAVARLIRRVRPDIVHANSPRAGLMSALGCRLGGPPLVVHLRDDLPPQGMGRAVRAVLARSADAVVAVSRFTARRFDEGLGRPLATPVYNSIDHERFDPDRVAPAPVREELGIAADAPLLAQVSQISPWKGQATSVRAVAELRRSGLDAHLLVVGEVAFAGRQVRYDNQAYLQSLHRLRTDLGVTGAVHFLGRRQDVPALLRAVDLSLLPSCNEPFGRAIVESMAMGTPALVSRIGSGPELVEDRVSGRLLDPESPAAWAGAAAELIGDRDALTRMGAAARVAAERFNDDAQVRGVLEVYERVLGRPPGTVIDMSIGASWPA